MAEVVLTADKTLMSGYNGLFCHSVPHVDPHTYKERTYDLHSRALISALSQ